MMDYEYTKDNRLGNPHKYMYTPYNGSVFLDAYIRDRLKYYKIFQHVKKHNNKVYMSLYLQVSEKLKIFLDKDFPDESIKSMVNWEEIIKLSDYKDNKIDLDTVSLSSFNISVGINSEKLIVSLLYCQIDNEKKSLVKFWMDYLVQRFEVTKKIYTYYPVHLNNGNGNGNGRNVVRVYWLFALSLSLLYCTNKNIKYLNTLLKVTDLLCSLNEELLAQDIPLQGLMPILLVELLSVKSLSKNINEVSFDFA